MYLADTKFWSIANMLNDPRVAVLAVPMTVANGVLPEDPYELIARSIPEVNSKLYLGMEPDKGPLAMARDMLHGALKMYGDRGVELVIIPIPLPVNDPVFRMPDALAREEIFNRARATVTKLWHTYGEAFAPRSSRTDDVQIVIKTMMFTKRMETHEYSDGVLQTMTMLSEEVLNESIKVSAQESEAAIAAKAGYAARELLKDIRGIMTDLTTAEHIPVKPVEERTLLERAYALHEQNRERLDIEAIYMESHEYPGSQIEAHGGVPLDTEYWYVSNTFLNGLVNYGNNHRPFLIARYGLDINVDDTSDETVSVFDKFYPDGLPDGDGVDEAAFESVRAVYQKHCNSVINSQVHQRFTGDDWLVMYETESAFVFMWYDQDVSDCGVSRYSRESCDMVGIQTFEEFVVQRLALYLKTNSSHCASYTPLHKPLIVEPESKMRSGWLGG